MNYNKSVPSLALVVALGLSLSACGGSPSAAVPSPNVESLAPSTPTPSASPEGKKSSRGNIVKAFAEPAVITDLSSDKPIVTFTVNSITADVPCTGPYPSAVENGNIVVLDVTIETSPELASDEAGYDVFDMNPSMFKFVGANGTTFNGDLGTQGAYSCLPDEQQVGANGGGVGPGEKVTGKIALDLPEKTGTLVFKSYLVSGSGGWEWAF
ncbi:DUF4352 domain-containing protein [Arthrobacter sp. zg-Y820]|uniref:DUF4352 domain-containing protein n=1 Tax=unclassified Arthrobacter TaxID=235627 RepID=UPI001E31DD4E|nr:MULTISPECIES: DUF4352 domain-containing protein [unclassified Arthrobacter]MCC9197762.1 DUF4352 domain-containing protein [Arthrobacter sp. zg-Y820]MDK1280629.1 DUF4352 domain-containing protein [Arthrobacter sp. zg.Y820]WIB10737.1 DUF4352 domain-containing protein [Arthrobacter sp. zg-Y820]